MSVQKMKLVTIAGNMESLEDASIACLQAGCFQPEETAEAMGLGGGFHRISDENRYGDLLRRLEELFADAPPPLVPLQGKPDPTVLEGAVETLEAQVKSMRQENETLRKTMENALQEADQLEHFSGIHLNLRDAFDSKFVRVRFGRLPLDGYEKMKDYADNPYVLFFPCSKDKAYYWGMYLTPADESREVDRIFASLFFERIRIPEAVGTPHEAVDYLREKAEKARQMLAENEKKIASYFSENSGLCAETYSGVKTGYAAFEVRKYAAQYNNSFLLVGWVPAAGEREFIGRMEQVEGIKVSAEKPQRDSKRFTPPTRIRNPRLFRPYEYYVKMYGAPGYHEMDPTILVAITYTLLYGIMFADLGQGLILSLAGWFMYRKLHNPVGRILIPCGICGSIFGLLFGSCFGEFTLPGGETLLETFWHNIVGIQALPYSTMNNANSMLGFSVLGGILLILLAMVLNIYSCLKQHKVGEALFGHNGLCGILFFSSAVTLILQSGIVVNWNFGIPTRLLIAGCIVPFVLIFFKPILSKLLAREAHPLPESWGEYCIENFFELFEVILSYMSNSLSFLRVAAFVMVHSVMMEVFLLLAEMCGAPGSVGFLAMYIFGNIFVLVLEGLLVAIQVLRLEFYEIFSRCYIGEGQTYRPLSLEPEE